MIKRIKFANTFTFNNKDMKKILLTLIIMSIIVKGHSQTKGSLLYNSKGQLRADTSLTISSNQLKIWSKIEDFFISGLIKNVKYSPLASEENLNGISIVSFDIDSLGQLKNFKIIKEVGGGLEIQTKIWIKTFEYLTSLAPTNGRFTYFLAIKFSSIDATDFIKKENLIPISNVEFNFIQH